ncbi:hypothetical protein L4D00_09445 [Photobacterium swingsii]|uniref:Uncharacterized protein n=2 Tax=Photobacterium TaxID=657 RepID=A0AAW7Y822_9GAMM|nr:MULTISPECIES: hypothetical protein [Photobacterium]KMV29311.1 membrane protein [Photobacterium swingsii]KXI22697.1 hypothetical protein AS132_12100 [Photobacterium sanguinicancri]MDO6500609.1 hypothetical protein [Photobacterium sanguinicancri]MDO6544411.1 hypothetical protein [Photobacterium sanguinicancri]OZS44315.1 hypothetical protein ASV53_08840 [Photobacterium sanguinicancri]
MLTHLDRLTIYSVLCFITFCSLVLRGPADASLFALGGVIAAALGLWFELMNTSELEEEELK